MAVIGGGNSAGEEILFLTRFAEKVTLLARGETLSAGKIVCDKPETHPKVEILYNTEIREFHRSETGKLNGVTAQNRKTGDPVRISPDGVFVFIGMTPNSAWLSEIVVRDKYGFIVTNAVLEASLAGVFAAGDVRFGSTKQAASAAGEGATAALMIRDYLKRN